VVQNQSPQERAACPKRCIFFGEIGSGDRGTSRGPGCVRISSRK
jgi:hypothetical protein